MVERTVFEDALREISTAHEGRDEHGGLKSLCRPFLRVLPVTGAAISTIGSGLGVATICASDEAVARIDELQIDLGEGPCWDALATGRPVIHADVATEPRPSWPAFMEALREFDIGALFAFPLSLGELEVGSVDLYSSTPRGLSETEVADVSALARLAAWQVLRRVLADDSPKAFEVDGDPSPGFSRKQVHQATGMIIAQLDVPAPDALLLLRAHAFASGRTVRDVAHDVVSRRLDFSPGAFGAES
ncbi:hypothetical protein B7R54_15940 [Subtercola boreus]|uniref:ANTAR domain-containing protein n=1 Tax=Subtercola boreus TaxID=120213 RepID=A0A3E0VLL5_9MICO|nr:GAF and ANTAR domain-containing protein [Subtercola boreus]RFA10529.1 hypothetical protein B7R54_15940 [Subtercola boreus]TQL55933.1 ANTAR domain-containing protein [Subtercola boreus]